MLRARNLRGVSVPSFFYGTAWKEAQTAMLTKKALESGFVAIDTANQRKHYFEAGVGDGIAAAVAERGIARSDLFLQTKFTYARGQDHRLAYDPTSDYTTQVEQSFAGSLEHLRTTYLDSYVLHGPSSGHGISDTDREVWRAMESLVHTKGVRLLGVSNVSLEQLRTLTHEVSIKPAFVQNRCYARDGWDREIRAFCAVNDMQYQGFSLLTANASALDSDVIRKIRARTGKSLAQVVFRFALGVGMIPLTGTTDEAHMREDLEAFDFELDRDELRAIETLSV
jgi:diketogulonate reductase-like aldo/keto reductase